MMVNTKKIVLLALFVAMASVLHVVESWIPLPLPVPGIKLGLANIVSLVAIYLYGWHEAIYIAILRVLLGSLFGGTLLGPAFFMSMSGAIVSTSAMAFVQYYWQPPFSIIGVSVIGSVVHSFAQIMIAALLVTSSSLLWYLPYLIVFAVAAGVLTGLTTNYFLAKVPRFC